MSTSELYILLIYDSEISCLYSLNNVCFYGQVFSLSCKGDILKLYLKVMIAFNNPDTLNKIVTYVLAMLGKQ